MSSDDLPTARSMSHADQYRYRLTCRACLHWIFADLEAVIASGRGDVPLVELRWRCGRCGHRRIDAVVEGQSRPRSG